MLPHAGSTIAIDISKHVQTLNITEATQMDALTARRFENVEQVKISCLISYHDRWTHILSPDAFSAISAIWFSQIERGFCWRPLCQIR